ncbi:MAG: DUF3977 family protein [bacterium]|nr:DUF3977 family protein [bacterium]
MKRIFAEMGLGNETFFSTEIEEGEGDTKREYRIPKFIRPEKIDDHYLRLWIFKRVFIFSTKDGFITTKKDRSKFKILFGIGGETDEL